MEKEKNKPEVYIERAAPATINGIRAVCGSDEEYKWYCKGLEDGRKKIKEAVEDAVVSVTARIERGEDPYDLFTEYMAVKGFRRAVKKFCPRIFNGLEGMKFK